jgi:hypothetical protein
MEAKHTNKKTKIKNKIKIDMLRAIKYLKIIYILDFINKESSLYII